MKLNKTYKTILKHMSKGHIQLRELTDRVNEELGTNFLQSTVSARIG